MHKKLQCICKNRNFPRNFYYCIHVSISPAFPGRQLACYLSFLIKLTVDISSPAWQSWPWDDKAIVWCMTKGWLPFVTMVRGVGVAGWRSPSIVHVWARHVQAAFDVVPTFFMCSYCLLCHIALRRFRFTYVS